MIQWMFQWLKRFILGFHREAVPGGSEATCAVPNIDFEEVPTILPAPPSMFVAHFGEGFKKEGVVCHVGSNMVTIVCTVPERKNEIGAIVVLPMQDVRLSML